jgi:hypothetical protein
MILTCLRCGKQFKYDHPVSAAIACECGAQIAVPAVFDTGVRPNQRSADRLRYKAFVAAGIVSNVGAIALGLAVLGFIFPPFALGAIGVAVYLLITKRGALGRWSGRTLALVALALGIFELVAGTYLFTSWLSMRQVERIATLQEGATEDLRALVRAERGFFAANEQYGSSGELRFKPPRGTYTIFLAPNDRVDPAEDGCELAALPVDLPAGLEVGVSTDGFTAVALCNLDQDETLDVWVITHQNNPVHFRDDATE